MRAMDLLFTPSPLSGWLAEALLIKEFGAEVSTAVGARAHSAPLPATAEMRAVAGKLAAISTGVPFASWASIE